MERRIAIFLVICVIIGVAESRTACFVVTGQMQCASQSEKHMDVELNLMDDDGRCENLENF